MSESKKPSGEERGLFRRAINFVTHKMQERAAAPKGP
jgi:hypothetical protein